MSWHNGGRTYRAGQAESDADLFARLRAARERDAAAQRDGTDDFPEPGEIRETGR